MMCVRQQNRMTYDPQTVQSQEHTKGQGTQGTRCVGKKGVCDKQPEEKVPVGLVPGYSVGVHGRDTNEGQKEKGLPSPGSSTSGPCDFGQAPSPQRLAFSHTF